MAYAFSMRGSSYVADTLELASKIYCRLRDESGEGNSTFPSVNVRNSRGAIECHISYNGRVWPGRRTQWTPGAVPLYDNRKEP